MAPMTLDDADRLLDPAPMALEMGWERLPDGALHVACRTDMHGCRGDMLTWWFSSRPGTQQYVWWHPLDHRSSTWDEGVPGTHVGAVHRVEESFSGSPQRQLLIQFCEPGAVFGAEAWTHALASGAVSAVVTGRGGESWQAPRDAQDRILGSRLLHVGRDTEWGLVLRSHFFLGCDLPGSGLSPDAIQALIPDGAASGLLSHCYSEFTYLSRFLPSLYQAENRAALRLVAPW